MCLLLQGARLIRRPMNIRSHLWDCGSLCSPSSHVCSFCLTNWIGLGWIGFAFSCRGVSVLSLRFVCFLLLLLLFSFVFSFLVADSIYQLLGMLVVGGFSLLLFPVSILFDSICDGMYTHRCAAPGHGAEGAGDEAATGLLPEAEGHHHSTPDHRGRIHQICQSSLLIGLDWFLTLIAFELVDVVLCPCNQITSNENRMKECWIAMGWWTPCPLSVCLLLSFLLDSLFAHSIQSNPVQSNCDGVVFPSWQGYRWTAGSWGRC